MSDALPQQPTSLKGAEGLCGVCGWKGSGVRPRTAQGAYVCGECDTGQRDIRDFAGREAVWDYHHATGLYVNGWLATRMPVSDPLRTQLESLNGYGW